MSIYQEEEIEKVKEIFKKYGEKLYLKGPMHFERTNSIKQLFKPD